MIRRSIFFAVLLALLVASMIPASTSAQDAQPNNYCTTVVVEATTSGYIVNATGAGRYARIRDLTASATVVATDFGVGATVYTWTGLTLDTSHLYQVQVSHTSLSTGFSTAGCFFSPPPPQAVTVERFEIVALTTKEATVFEWDVSKDGLAYWVNGFDNNGEHAWTKRIPAQNPGGTGYFQYQVAASVPMLPKGTYILMAEDENGRIGEAARLEYAPPSTRR